MLAFMKDAKVLHISGDGHIQEGEFKRLIAPEVLKAAEKQLKSQAL
jgi:hypothetical protein